MTRKQTVCISILSLLIIAVLHCAFSINEVRFLNSKLELMRVRKISIFLWEVQYTTQVEPIENKRARDVKTKFLEINKMNQSAKVPVYVDYLMPLYHDVEVQPFHDVCYKYLETNGLPPDEFVVEVFSRTLYLVFIGKNGWQRRIAANYILTHMPYIISMRMNGSTDVEVCRYVMTSMAQFMSGETMLDFSSVEKWCSRIVNPAKHDTL